jgi:hypothetical protein
MAPKDEPLFARSQLPKERALLLYLSCALDLISFVDNAILDIDTSFGIVVIETSLRGLEIVLLVYIHDSDENCSC